MMLQVDPCASTYRIFHVFFEAGICAGKIFGQRPRATQFVSKGISGPLLIKKGPLHIPTSVASPLRILGGLVNAGVSPNRVTEVPYYGRDGPCRVMTPFSLRIIISVPSKSTGEGTTSQREGELLAKSVQSPHPVT